MGRPTMPPVFGAALGLSLPNAEWQYSFLAGLAHPILGLDHFFALLGVGLWAGKLGQAARWMLPAAFLAGMLLGFLLVIEQPPSFLLDSLVKLLAIASGPLIAAALVGSLRLPFREAVTTVALMGGCHGYVHGLELGSAGAMGFSVGFIAAGTSLLGLGLAVSLASVRRR